MMLILDGKIYLKKSSIGSADLRAEAKACVVARSNPQPTCRSRGRRTNWKLQKRLGYPRVGFHREGIASSLVTTRS